MLRATIGATPVRIICILTFFALTNICLSQVTTFYVHPIQTDPRYEAAQDSHVVFINTATNIHKLFLFLGGSGSEARQYLAIGTFAASLGFDVISLSYPNAIPAAVVGGSPDSLAFDKFRQEVCYGTPLSPFVDVDTLNCIYTRTVNVIRYLDASYPDQNWDQYLVDSSTLDWSKIAVGGHSQGSGHACYFAKFNEVDRVLMFSGPNDYSFYYSSPAHWLKVPGVTALNRHYANLALLDELVPFDNQLANLEGLGLFPLHDTVSVDLVSPPYNGSHCLYTTQPPGLAITYHNSTIRLSATNFAVWTYMLTSDVSTSVQEDVRSDTYILYPNPTHSMVNIQSESDMLGKRYTVWNAIGQLVLKGRSEESAIICIDLSSCPAGLYLVRIDNKTLSVIKQ